MLVMLIFGAVSGSLNALGWYSQKLPDQKVSITQAQVTELTGSVGKTSINPWTSYTVLSTVFNVGGAALLSLLTIIPFLTAYGISYPIALMIQTPIWLILIWTVYEMWTGHSTTMQE